jgi:hypothetical protein
LPVDPTIQIARAEPDPADASSSSSAEAGPEAGPEVGQAATAGAEGCVAASAVGVEEDAAKSEEPRRDDSDEDLQVARLVRPILALVTASYVGKRPGANPTIVSYNASVVKITTPRFA